MDSIKTRFTFQILPSSIESIESLAQLPTAAAPSDALIICAASRETTALPSLQGLHPNLLQAIQQLRVKKIFTGEAKQIHIIPTLGLSPYAHIILMGLGDYQAIQTIKTGNTAIPSIINNYRDMAARLTRMIQKHKIASFTVYFSPDLFLPPFPLFLESIVQAFTEGVLLGGYRMKSYRQEREKIVPLREAHYLIEPGSSVSIKNDEPDLQSIELSIQRAEICALSTNYARDLTNLPGNMLVPSNLAVEALGLAEKYGFECTILDEEEILKQGMGGLYNVGKGSIHPPRMIMLKYQGLPSSTDMLGLVGKGITFDTGGIS
ncbi:MAG TPA: M17 family peptidase N-terminal domain-containing protein, partial [Bacilli bacterium]